MIFQLPTEQRAAATQQPQAPAVQPATAAHEVDPL